jgi:rRNA maturation endonuclease Nob1
MPLVAVVILVVAITTLFTLFVRAKDIPPPEPVSPTKHLEDRKAVIYENLRDLQFEYRVGKLSDADYQQTKLTLQKELASVMAEIDRVAAMKAPTKASSPAAKTAKSEPKPEAIPAPANVCPHCNAVFPKPMKFCGECGKAMA